MFKRGWEHGQAAIIAREVAGADRYHTTYDYVVDVQPDSGAPVFRAAFKERFAGGEFHEPEVGERAPVKFSPKTEEVEFERSALRAQLEASEEARRERFEAIASAAPGTGTPQPAAAPAGGGGDLTAALSESREILAAIMQARAAGDRAEVERLKGEMQRLAAEHPAPSGVVRPPTPSGGTSSDPFERLQQLADLHDRGVLTDEEFAAAKAKILGDG